MKKRISALILSLLLIGLITGSALPAYAATPIDPGRASSLTLQYRQGEQAFEGLEIKTYRVAEVFADGTYALRGAFKDYPVDIYGITSQTQWHTVATTLAAYATADQIEPTCSAVTDETGTVAFCDILPGMYLTLAVSVQSGRTVTTFDHFLTMIPGTGNDGDALYDVTAYPKCASYTVSPDMIEYKIVKQWKGDGNTGIRPRSVEIDILRDGVIMSTQTLTADENWAYSWSAPDDGSRWQAVERRIPADYTVTVTEEGDRIIITNAYTHKGTEPPKTGDTTLLWPYALTMSVSGGVIILLAMWRKRDDG